MKSFEQLEVDCGHRTDDTFTIDTHQAAAAKYPQLKLGAARRFLVAPVNLCTFMVRCRRLCARKSLLVAQMTSLLKLWHRAMI